MGPRRRTTYFDIDADYEPTEDGWVIEGPDALNLFARWLPSDADGCVLTVLLDAAYRVIGCDVIADTQAEAKSLRSDSVLRSVQEAQAARFILVNLSTGQHRTPSRQERVVARMVGLRAAMLGVDMVDYAVIARMGGYWSAYAMDLADW